MQSDRGGDYERGDDQGRDGESKGRRSFHRKKVCRFCADTDNVLDYKDARMMQSFLSDRGKIVPRRISGTCAFHQRKLTVSIKRARNLALVGFVSSGAEPRERDYSRGGEHHRGEQRDRDHRERDRERY